MSPGPCAVWPGAAAASRNVSKAGSACAPCSQSASVAARSGWAVKSARRARSSSAPPRSASSSTVKASGVEPLPSTSCTRTSDSGSTSSAVRAARARSRVAPPPATTSRSAASASPRLDRSNVYRPAEVVVLARTSLAAPPASRRTSSTLVPSGTGNRPGSSSRSRPRAPVSARATGGRARPVSPSPCPPGERTVPASSGLSSPPPLPPPQAASPAQQSTGTTRTERSLLVGSLEHGEGFIAPLRVLRAAHFPPPSAAAGRRTTAPSATSSGACAPSVPTRSASRTHSRAQSRS